MTAATSSFPLAPNLLRNVGMTFNTIRGRFVPPIFSAGLACGVFKTAAWAISWEVNPCTDAQGLCVAGYCRPKSLRTESLFGTAFIDALLPRIIYVGPKQAAARRCFRGSRERSRAFHSRGSQCDISKSFCPVARSIKIPHQFLTMGQKSTCRADGERTLQPAFPPESRFVADSG